MRFAFDHWIERGDDEFELRVIYEGSHHVPETRWQPAEGGECEIISVTCGSEEFALSEAEQAILQEACEERVASDFCEEACAAAEWREQERCDARLMGEFF